MCLHNHLLIISPLPGRKGARGKVRPIIEAQLLQAGSPEGCNPTGRRYGGVPRPESGSPEGAALWQGSGGVPQFSLFYSPLPSRKGARGMVRPIIEAQLLQAGSPEGCNPTGRRNGGCASITSSSLFPPSFQEGGQGDGAPHNRSAAPASGESRGVQPHWQAEWRMCLHNHLLLNFPLPGRKGARGKVRPIIEAQPLQAGSPEECNPTGRRHGGCASITTSSLFPPSWKEGG